MERLDGSGGRGGGALWLGKEGLRGVLLLQERLRALCVLPPQEGGDGCTPRMRLLLLGHARELGIDSVESTVQGFGDGKVWF
jgi:hypothetical protein